MRALLIALLAVGIGLFADAQEVDYSCGQPETGACVVQGIAAGCDTEERFDELGAIILEGGIVAFGRALEGYERAGLCRSFERGEKVWVMDSNPFRAPLLVRLRVDGEQMAFWTNATVIWPPLDL